MNDDVMFIRDLLQRLAGVLVMTGVLLIGLRAVLRWWRRRALRKELEVLRGGRPMFTGYGDLVDRPPRPPLRSLRKRGEDDHAA